MQSVVCQNLVYQALIRIWRVILYRYRTDLLALRASALTFTSALSVVPVLAVMFGIAKGFGIEKILEQMLREEFQEQKEVIQYLIQFGYTLLEQTRGGLIAGIGIITLFYTVLRLLSTIEDALNTMWGIKKGRSIPRKIIDFLALVLIGPIFFVIASSLTVFVTTQVETLRNSNIVITHLQPFIVKTVVILPYLMISTFFTFLYMYMPNAKVKFSSAVFAGICSGVAYQVLQASYISIQIQVSKTGAIYGSFAALPLFLMWLYFSWLIFLIGAELMVICQERLWDPTTLPPFRILSPLEKKLAFLVITKAAIDAFSQEEPPLSFESLSKSLKMPVRLLKELVDELIAAKILLQTTMGIVPAKHPHSIRLLDVLQATDGENLLPITTTTPHSMDVFEKLLNEISTISEINERNIHMDKVGYN